MSALSNLRNVKTYRATIRSSNYGVNSVQNVKRPHAYFLLSLLLCSLAMYPLKAQAAKIAPELVTKLNATAEQELIEVVITIAGGISAPDLNAHLDSTCQTQSERRRDGVLLLQEIASKSQINILNYLNQQKSAGRAQSITSHWLTNTISVELFKSGVETIAKRFDVTEVFQYPTINPILPILYRSSAPPESIDSGGVEENLKYIGADSAWALGYTGAGRIVCHFDFTGVEGTHPALINNWKGLDGNPTAAWKGKWTVDSFPAIFNSFSSHGTHVVGIMVGHDDLTGDTIGVAPGAKWIGARAEHWEWAANPDGNPFTTDDVPDVINISFITSFNCWDRWYDLIDMTEALGIVNIFAAGNSGSGPSTIASPASRATDSLSNFAVGSLDHRSGWVWWSSSRGPSSCNGQGIKPNVSAPGSYIRSSVPGGLYEIQGGTSMAAPHVSGAVAILRQFAPNSTVKEIKQALLAGATPRGTPFPNNDFGWGVINIPASMEYLAGRSKADIRVLAFDHLQTVTSDTVRVDMVLRNRGASLDSITIKFPNNTAGISVLTDSIYLGRIAQNQTANQAIELRALFADTMYAGAMVTVDYTIEGAGNYLKVGQFSVRAGIAGERTHFAHNTGLLQFSVSNFGVFSDFIIGPTDRSWLFDASLMLGTDSAHVSDGFRNALRDSDNDFWYDAKDSLEVTIPGLFADQETRSIFDDGRAENRIGIQVQQKSYSWDSAPNNKYIILEFALENITDKPIEGLFAGLALDWTFQRPNYDFNVEGDFARGENLGFLFKHTSETDSADFRGAAVLNNEGVASYQVITQQVNGFVHNPSFTEYTKFKALSGGIVDTNALSLSGETLLHIISTGPFSLAPGESDTAIFAILGADLLSELKLSASQAQLMVQKLVAENELPNTFVLHQNYPNPFNATTKIDITIPQPGLVELEIFNLLGQRVTTLVNEFRPAGDYTVNWSGKNSSGEVVASGIYFYRLKSANATASKKMILLK